MRVSAVGAYFPQLLCSFPFQAPTPAISLKMPDCAILLKPQEQLKRAARARRDILDLRASYFNPLEFPCRITVPALIYRSLKVRFIAFAAIATLISMLAVFQDDGAPKQRMVKENPFVVANKTAMA